MVDAWAALADPFGEGAYATVKGRVRTFVLHAQLLRHLPALPATVLDVGGGAGHQSVPLARLGYSATLLDPSAAMLAKAEQRLAAEPDEVHERGVPQHRRRRGGVGHGAPRPHPGGPAGPRAALG